MATRLYLPASGASPLGALAIDAGWESAGGAFFRAPAVAAKSNTALADFNNTFPSTDTQQMCFAQWISETLADAHTFTTGETVSIVVRCREGNTLVNASLAYVLRVVSGDGATVRGVLKSQMASDSEWPTVAATRIFSAAALAEVAALAGDRIVIEIGAHGEAPSTGYTSRQRFGDPSGTGDFALTAGLTTDLCPWVELSPTLAFGTPPATPDQFIDGVWG